MRFILFPLALFASLALANVAHAATAVGLGTADSYAVLAGSGVTNVGPTVVNGDLGTSPLPAVVGFEGGLTGTVNGTIHADDAAAEQAQVDLTTAYDNAAGQGPTTRIGTELGGATLTPGVYDSASGTFEITEALTLNAQGDPSAVFIFKTATTLVTASFSQVNLINGAQPCNVFWKVGSSATLNSDSAFVGNILALESISLTNAVTVNGRLLARGGAVTMINDTVTRPTCATTGGDSSGGEGGGGTATGGTTGTSPGATGQKKGSGRDGAGGNGRGRGADEGRPTVRVNGFPTRGGNRITDGGGRCAGSDFVANVRVRGPVAMRRVEVFVDGRSIKRTTSKRFSVTVDVAGLRSGRNTIRVLAVDRNGRRDVASKGFRRCSLAQPSPSFTG
jgi:Ice-binding-like